MKLHILTDNLPNQYNPNILYEHGLCMLLQTDEDKNYLIDTGASGKFIENLEILRQTDSSLPTVEEIDAVIISHGHNDHTGGLRSFFEANSTATVYLHSSIQGNLFFSCRNRSGATTPAVMEARSIGMEQSLFAEYGDRFVHISDPTAITGNITVIPMGGKASTYPTPLGNRYLYKNDFPDDFSHEVVILVEFAPQQYAIISPCSHNGILNILSIWTSSQGAVFFIGGLHYVDYLSEEDSKKEAAQIVQAAMYIKDHYPNLKVFSGHCTGSAARDVLQDALKEKYTHFYAGTTIELK